MDTTRVLVANGFLSYREAIAAVLRELRPGIEVFTAEPMNLDWEVARLRPVAVICGRITPVIEARVPVWVELHPNHRAFSVVSVEGERSTVPDMQFSDLLSILDRAEDLRRESVCVPGSPRPDKAPEPISGEGLRTEE